MKIDLRSLHGNNLPDFFLDAKISSGRCIVKGLGSDGELVEETALPVGSTVREILAEVAGYIASSNVAKVVIET